MSSPARHATRQRAGRDVLMQVVVRVFNLALGVVVTALLARSLGSDYFGQWSTLFVILGLVGFSASFGMEGVVVREAAARPEHEHEWLGAMMMLRLMLFTPAILLSIGAVFLLHRSHEMLISGLILTTSMPFDGIGVLALVFQLRINNLVPMLVLTIRSVLWGIAVAIIYWQGGSMIDLAIALAATNAVGSVVQTLAAMRVLPQWPRPSRKRLRSLITVGVPLGISGVLIIAYARIDQLIVYTIAGSRASGLYGAVYGVLEQAHFIPISVLTTLSPIIAATFLVDRERMLRIVKLAAELLAVSSFGAVAFVAVAATQVVRAIFGAQFTAAAPALPVLGGAFVFICFGYLNGSLMTVLGQQRRMMRISLLALVVNVAGNLILVPVFGFMGAAWMTLVTEMVVCGASLRIILAELDIHRLGPGRVGRSALAAVLLGAGLYALKLAGTPLGGLIVAACLLYSALLFGLRAIEMEDLRVLVRREKTA
jgi:O-antigen/teichoic acid export membrane protein